MLKKFFLGSSWKSSVVGYVLAGALAAGGVVIDKMSDPKSDPVTGGALAAAALTAILGRLKTDGSVVVSDTEGKK